MTNNEEINEKFEELVRKAEEESKKRQKKLNFALLIIELALQICGIAIIVYKLGWLVGLGIFLWSTANNLQTIRSVKKNN